MSPYYNKSSDFLYCEMGKSSNRELSKEFLNFNHGSISSSVPVNKRVWVKRINGHPTSIMMNKSNIIDDLKAAVFEKYPNTLAKFHDSSELQILVSLQRWEQTQQTKTPKNKIGRLKSEPSDESSYKNAVNNDMANESVLSLLEPDRNVWEILDEFFGGDMRMNDALVIDVTKEQSEIRLETTNLNLQKYDDPRTKDLEHLYSPSPSQLSVPRANLSASNLQTPKPQIPQQFSKVLEKTSPDSPRYLSETSQVTNTHKRSQSSPSQSPISLAQPKSSNSQAVLLLPKNFSLGEQHSLKRLSLDENLIQKTSTNQKINVTNIGARTPDKRSNLREDSMSVINPHGTPDSNPGSTAKLPLPNTDPVITKAESNTESSAKSHSKVQESKHDRIEKTLNTSTFEQVLPSISVLVVEDNSINQAILGAFLRKHKIHYQIAKNGQEAVDKWRRGGFHLVLMDIQLPVKSGIEATKEIRLLEKVNRIGVFAQHELANSQATGHLEIKEDQKLDLNIFRSPVIIVALTASSNSSVDKKNALTAGCNDFLTKPVNLVWLQNKITEWGCMQALIDFDGWRCKGNSTTPSSIKSGSLSSSSASSAKS